MNGISEVRRRW